MLGTATSLCYQLVHCQSSRSPQTVLPGDVRVGRIGNLLLAVEPQSKVVTVSRALIVTCEITGSLSTCSDFWLRGSTYGLHSVLCVHLTVFS